VSVLFDAVWPSLVTATVRTRMATPWRRAASLR
jgi:hypothetical protein